MTKRQKTAAARRRVLEEIWRKGTITHARACAVGGFAQARYHLTALAKAGLIEHDKFNSWRAVGPIRDAA
jgi:hypothetical protein